MIVHMIILAVLMALAVRSTLSSDDRNKNAIYAIAALFFTGIWIIFESMILNIAALLVISTLVWYLAGKSRTVLNTALTAITVILIGYSSNAIIVIRASAGTPLNENNPSNPNNLLYFLGAFPVFNS